MQLTSFTDYALRTLVYLGLQPDDRLVSVNEICENYKMPRNHLIKVTQQLSQLGYIHSVRGRMGGIRIRCNLDEVTVGQVVNDFEKRLSPLNCASTSCPTVKKCQIRCILVKAQKAFMDELYKYPLSKVIDKPEQLAEILRIESA